MAEIGLGMMAHVHLDLVPEAFVVADLLAARTNFVLNRSDADISWRAAAFLAHRFSSPCLNHLNIT